MVEEKFENPQEENVKRDGSKREHAIWGNGRKFKMGGMLSSMSKGLRTKTAKPEHCIPKDF